VSSDIGKNHHFFNKHLVGGVAILTFGHWASKVCISSNDPGGNGTFTATTIQEKQISFISAYPWLSGSGPRL